MSGQTLEYLHVSIYASKSIADPLPYFWVWLEQTEPKPRTAPASPAEGLSSQFLEGESRGESKEISATWVQIVFCYLRSRENYGLWKIVY